MVNMTFVNMTNNRNGSVSNNTTCCESHPFSDSLIIWIYNENLYKDVNLPCMVYLCILAVLGIFGNSLVIYIYGFKFKRSTSHFFILSLAVLDNMCCIAMIMEIFDKRFSMYSGNYVILCKIIRLVEMFATISSSALLLCIAFDRYCKVCKPLNRKFFSYRTARKCLIFCLIIGLLLSWPMFLLKGPEKIETGVKNVVGYDCGDDDNFRGPVIRPIYFGLIGILNIISILLLAAMYIRIFRAIQIWKHKQIGESMPSSRGSVISSSYKISRVKSWLKRSKQKQYNPEEEMRKTLSISNSISDHEIPYEEHQSHQNGSVLGQSMTSMTSQTYLAQSNSTDYRRISTISTNSLSTSKRDSKKCKKVTTNTVLFSVVTIIYIISYLPTIVVETLKAGGVFTDVELPDTTRRILVVLNVTYFINNVCNQYVYSSIDPAFRKQIKQIFTG